MKSCAFFLLAAILASGTTAAACKADSASSRVTLVELYTSEGCSSCPPADRWLSRLAGVNDPGVVALAFHVDYWDDLGWRDRFADAAYGKRQRERVAAEGGRVVFTPQLVVDGHTRADWRDTTKVPHSMTKPGASIQISQDAEIDIRARLFDLRDAMESRLYVALTEDGLHSDVAAGENRGVRLRHDAVVRRFFGPFEFDERGNAQQQLSSQLPAGVVPARAAWVAFVQRARDGQVLQAMRFRPSACGG